MHCGFPMTISQGLDSDQEIALLSRTEFGIVDLAKKESNLCVDSIIGIPLFLCATQASLIPKIDSLRSLGIVWIPGVMAGMVLSGSDPVYAAIFQFVVVAMIFASSGLTSIVSTLLIRTHAFSPADQLILRPTD